VGSINVAHIITAHKLDGASGWPGNLARIPKNPGLVENGAGRHYSTVCDKITNINSFEFLVLWNFHRSSSWSWRSGHLLFDFDQLRFRSRLGRLDIDKGLDGGGGIVGSSSRGGGSAAAGAVAETVAHCR